MPIDRLIISNMATGFETDRLPFNIANDAFPILNNAYIWRGRILRKRGTSLLGRLERMLTAQALGNTSGGGAFSGNIFAILSISTASSPSIVLNSITVTVGADVFTEPTVANGTLTGSAGGSGTINYATGALTLTGAPAATPVTITFSYYPSLPVMGFEDFDIGLVNQQLSLAFDTLFSYQFNQSTERFYDTTFYKVTGTPFKWNGANYQQFYSTNYLGTNTIADTPDRTGCIFVTNGNPGFHFQPIATVTNANPTIITTAVPHNLITGDWVWFNENSSADGIANLNGKSFQITKTGANTFTIPLNSAALAINNTGIFQSLTSSGITGTEDGIRWYDGDPGQAPTSTLGWVNFAPPLNAYDPITNPNPFYLVGALTVTPFKGRLIFSGVYLRTSATSPGTQYYPNRIVYSQVGTPFYTQPLPFPIANATPDTTAWYQNVAGKGGFLTAPIDQEIVTVAPVRDVLIYGMESQQLKLIYTFNDSLPFYFQTINSELGSQNTFSAVLLDHAVMSIGDYGLAITDETRTLRVDQKIPDQVFDIAIGNNASSRVTAIRDYQKEWIYFTYPPSQRTAFNTFNSRTLLYNYKEQNWATFDENYTHYGTFRRTTSRTWANIGKIYPTWADWNDPWDFGGDEANFPEIVGGNQEGFVMIKGDGTGEETSQFVSAINISNNQITSPNHCLLPGDFVIFQGIIGVLDAGGSMNGKVYQINTINANVFSITAVLTGAYLGGGIYSRLSQPSILSKQFPIYWNEGKQVRIGLQRYLFDTTPTGQVTVFIYSSQNANTADNDPSTDTYLPYNNIVLTSPEPSSLYSPVYTSGQDQTWHRMSSSFTGDSIQLGVTLSVDQMLDNDINEQDIVLHSIVLDLYRAGTLAI